MLIKFLVHIRYEMNSNSSEGLVKRDFNCSWNVWYYLH